MRTKPRTNNYDRSSPGKFEDISAKPNSISASKKRGYPPYNKICMITVLAVLVSLLNSQIHTEGPALFQLKSRGDQSYGQMHCQSLHHNKEHFRPGAGKASVHSLRDLSGTKKDIPTKLVPQKLRVRRARTSTPNRKRESMRSTAWQVKAT